MRGVAGGGGQGSALPADSDVSRSLEETTVQEGKAVGVIWGVFVLMAMLMSGCATVGQGISYFTAEADSMADLGADLGDKTYVIASAMQDTSDEDLAFKEIANWVRNALKLKGYRQVSRKEDASLLIRLAYGRGQPQTRTSTYTHAPGYSYRVGYYWYSIPPATSTTTRTTFDARLLLEAYDLKTPGKLPQVWKTTLTASDNDVNTWNRPPLRHEFVHMIGAALDCLGTNSGYKKVYLQAGPVGRAVVDSLCAKEGVAEPLLPTGADINAIDKNGWTPLHLAVWQGRRDLVELLIARGADINAKDKYGATPLHRAIFEGKKEMAELLIAKGADISAREDQHGATPLLTAAFNGQRQVAELLIAKGADMSAEARDGQTPLHYAAQAGKTEMGELLIAKGADINAKDQYGTTPLQYAVMKKHKQIEELLRKHGAK